MNGEQFKKTRIKLGMTQAEIAKALDVTETSVYRWESGRSQISKTLELALEALSAKNIKQKNRAVEKY